MVNNGERTGVTGLQPRLRIFSSLQSPSYRLFFTGILGQCAAMSMQMVTNPLLVFRLTGSPAMLGIMALIGSFPLIIMSIFGGAIADRLQKKHLLIAGLSGNALLSLELALALATGHVSRDVPGSYWIPIIAFGIQGMMIGLLMPALQAIIPEIVSKDRLMNAIALNNMEMNIMNLAASWVAGFLIDKYDFKIIYYIMCGLYIYASAFILFIPRTGKMAIQAGKILDDIGKGFTYIRQDPTIFFILIFSMAMVVLAMPFQQLLPIYADNILKVGATGMGLLMSVSGGGALAGSIILAILPDKKRGIVLLSSGAVAGAALLSFAFSSIWGLSLSLVVFIGLSQTIRSTIGVALLQSYAKPEYMGRVMSMLNLQFGIMSFSAFVAGMAASVVPVQWVVGGLATVLLIISLFLFIFGSHIRKMD